MRLPGQLRQERVVWSARFCTGCTMVHCQVNKIRDKRFREWRAENGKTGRKKGPGKRPAMGARRDTLKRRRKLLFFDFLCTAACKPIATVISWHYCLQTNVHAVSTVCHVENRLFAGSQAIGKMRYFLAVSPFRPAGFWLCGAFGCARPFFSHRAQLQGRPAVLGPAGWCER